MTRITEEITRICKRLVPVIGRKKANNLLKAYITSETLDEQFRMETFVNMFALKYLGSGIDDNQIHLPPTSTSSRVGDFALGTIIYSNQSFCPLYLNQSDFVKHVNICGITGSGKTNMGHILLTKLSEVQIPFLVIDWRRSWRAVLTLANNSIKAITVYSIGRNTGSSFHWNPLRGPPGVHVQVWLSTVCEVLEKSHLSGPGVSEILTRVLGHQLSQYATSDESNTDHPNFFDALEEVQRLKLRGRQLLWQDSSLRILRTFTQIGPAAEAFNARDPVRLENLFGKQVIFELDMELPKSLRVFFSEIVLRWLHLYRLGQGESDTLRHVIFLEEIHNLFPRSSIERQASNGLENLFREVRGFGQGIVSITQHPSLIPLPILANCNTQIYFGLQHEDDIRTAKKALFLDEDEAVFLDRLAVGEAIVKVKSRISPCLVRFPLVPIKKGVVTDEMINMGGKIYGKKRMDSLRDN